MATLVFLHGLNTFGDDDMRIGALRFGLMHERWERECSKRDIDFVGITGLGFGAPDDQADRAIRFLEEAGYLEAEGTKFDLLGHSVGGLAARAMASRPELAGRIRMIMTMGTPHRGTHVAELAMDLRSRHPLICRAMKTCGYDTEAKSAIFSNFTRVAVDRFNQQNRIPDGVREISLLCEATWGELSWPYLFGYRHLHPRESGAAAFPKSDGFISSESQKRGEILGPFAIDHYGELGYFFQLNPAVRRRARREFTRLVDTVAGLVSN